MEYPSATARARALGRQGIQQLSQAEQKELFHNLATEHMEKHGCSWAHACLAIKKKHPQAAELWGLPAA